MYLLKILTFFLYTSIHIISIHSIIYKKHSFSQTSLSAITDKTSRPPSHDRKPARRDPATIQPRPRAHLHHHTRPTRNDPQLKNLLQLPRRSVRSPHHDGSRASHRGKATRPRRVSQNANLTTLNPINHNSYNHKLPETSEAHRDRGIPGPRG